MPFTVAFKFWIIFTVVLNVAFEMTKRECLRKYAFHCLQPSINKYVYKRMKWSWRIALKRQRQIQQIRTSLLLFHFFWFCCTVAVSSIWVCIYVQFFTLSVDMLLASRIWYANPITVYINENSQVMMKSICGMRWYGTKSNLINVWAKLHRKRLPDTNL